MNILVFSDSHGHPDNIRDAISLQVKKPDAVIFLGDGQRDMAYAELDGIPTFCVAGNCDVSGMFADHSITTEQTLCLGGKRIFITHGHKYSVKSTLTSLVLAARDREADIVLFGHTHQCLDRVIDPSDNEYGIKLSRPMYLMNPGSIGYYPNSWGSIEIDREGRVLLSHGALL